MKRSRVFSCRDQRRKRLREDENSRRDGSDEALYLDRILDAAAEGAVLLLRELPREHLGSLRLMINQPIPSRARLDTWRLLLKHTAVRLSGVSLGNTCSCQHGGVDGH